MPEESIEYIENDDDVLVNNFNTGMFLVLGILSASASMILLVDSVTIAVNSQRLPVDLVNRLIFTAVFFIVGFGSLHIFRMRRESAKKKNSTVFLRRKS